MIISCFYKRITIYLVCFFDYILTEKEYKKAESVAYCDTKKNSKILKLFRSVESEFVEFYKFLYGLSKEGVYIIYNWEDFVSLQTYTEFNRHILNAMKERPLCNMLFPKLDMLVFTGYDLTHSFYILKTKVKKECAIKKMVTTMAECVGLHVF